jgi:hypothetical protein
MVGFGAVKPAAIVPLLVLLVLPAAFLAGRLGLLHRPRARLLGAVAAGGLLIASVPAGGLDFGYLKRLNLFIALAVVLLLLLRHQGAAWVSDRRRYLAALAVLAAAAVVVYLNFFTFHGERTWVHYHDVSHYYLGAKYFRELGYRHLYVAMLRAELETGWQRAPGREARDLETGELVPARVLLQNSDAARARFDDERWEAFKTDVAFLRQALGPHYQGVLRDHGFNPPPFWALLGGIPAGRVPAGSHAGIVLLTLIDPVLLTAAFVAIYWAFGLETLLLAVIQFCLIYGATFGWVGGAFLRYGWFFSLVTAACCLKRQRHGLAGVLFAVSALLRIFPAFFVAGIGLRALTTPGGRRLATPAWRLLAAFVGTAVALVLLTVAVYGDLGAWPEFRRNIVAHADRMAPNLVGLPFVITGAAGPDPGTRIAVAAAFLAAVGLAAVLSRRTDELGAAALGILLIVAGLNLAGYYYVFLVLLVLSRAGRPGDLALVFGVEVLSYALLLFEEREGVLYAYRSLLLLYLIVALHLDPIAGEVRRARDAWRRASAPAGQGP